VRADGRTGGHAVSRWGTTCLIAAGILLHVVPDVRAQNRPPARPTASPPESLTVYLMTMGPGERVWERFGHNAIWIHDPVRGTDHTYNYGLFDFGQENFLLRFVQGRMWYWMQGFPAQSYVESYRRVNRSVWVQELEMPPKARRELQAFLEWNERPENRFYHYDYYRDNCSTRVRDALDRALGGLIRERTSRLPTGRTYRFHTLRLTANDPPIFTGLLLALGQPVDRPITAWEEMFLPLALRVHIRNLTVTGPDGRPVPLVRSERTLFESSAAPPPASPPLWLPGYLLLGFVFGGLAFVLAVAASRSRITRYGFLAVAWGWLLISGIAGVVVTGLWGLTDHAAAYRNENMVQANVLALPLLWPVTRLVFGSDSAGRPAVLLALTIVALSVLGLLLKPLPQLYQVNGGIIALALPAHVGLAAGIWRLSRCQKPRTLRAPSRASG
jgi:hypothetical protein